MEQLVNRNIYHVSGMLCEAFYKSSSAAKLFNAVHKAQVSWNRIRPLLDSVNEEEDGKEWRPGDLEVKDVSFAYPDGKRVLEHVSFLANHGADHRRDRSGSLWKINPWKVIFM